MRPLPTQVTACPATLPLPLRVGDQSRATFSKGHARPLGTFPEISAPRAELLEGNGVVSADQPSQPLVRYRAWRWVGDTIGALRLFIILFGLLILGEALV